MFCFLTKLNMTLIEGTYSWQGIYFGQRCSQTLVFKMQIVESQINSVVKKIVFLN